MNNNLAVDTLIKKREDLLVAKAAAINQFNAEIQQINRAIETLSGQNVFEAQNIALYDDERHDYIKQSIED